jgi:glyoxylase-like metal-dependent hydrolase (beta-lactamase superfamily II)
MEIHVINTGFFKLDGGAMFGVVPKVLWGKANPADDHNLCTWAMRCLLVKDDKRLILIDTGCGNKQDAKFFGHYHLSGEDTLFGSLEKLGYTPEDITDVILTHLHFDHVGGAVIYDESQTKLVPAFPNALYWTNKKQWDWALNPNAREKASFLKENFVPLEKSGQLEFINNPNKSVFEDIEIMFVDGHTEHMMLPLITYNDKKILYAADLVPSAAHVPLAWVMSYDLRPMVTMSEKERILKQAADEGYILFFEHDPVNEAATVVETDRGVRVHKTGKLSDFI